MVSWRSFGVSEIGPGHLRAGLPNQDAFAVKGTSAYDCVVVSDGVGSAVKSDVGAQMVCEAVLETLEQVVTSGRNLDAASFVMEVKEMFLQKISPLPLHECSATCLFAIRYSGFLFVGLLGDGLVAVKEIDGKLKILCDGKAESFSNIVKSFAEDTRFEDWKTLVIPEVSCFATVLCTDGIGDDLIDVEGFVNGFIAEYSSKEISSAIREIQSLLQSWPTPKHSDDKTIACMFRKETRNDDL